MYTEILIVWKFLSVCILSVQNLGPVRQPVSAAVWAALHSPAVRLQRFGLRCAAQPFGCISPSRSHHFPCSDFSPIAFSPESRPERLDPLRFLSHRAKSLPSPHSVEHPNPLRLLSQPECLDPLRLLSRPLPSSCSAVPSQSRLVPRLLILFPPTLPPPSI